MVEMRILVFGATGPTGILFIREALASIPSCTLVLYVRSTNKVPDDIKANSSIVIVGGQLEDVELITSTMEGIEAIVSALGPSTNPTVFHPSDTPLAKAYSLIIDAMHHHNVHRILALGTASIKSPEDKFSLTFSLLVTGVATAAPHAYKDVVAIGETIRGKGADLDYTIVRVPLLNNKDTRGVRAGFVGDGKTSTHLARIGFAVFAVHELLDNDSEWIKRSPLISST